jgi:competence protein ComGC
MEDSRKGSSAINTSEIYNSKRKDKEFLTETILIPKINMENTDPPERRENAERKNERRGKNSNKVKRVAFTLLSVLIFILIITVLLSWKVYKDAMVVKNQISKINTGFSQKDINLVSSELGNSKNSINSLKKSYSYLGYLKIVPFVNSYYKDGLHFINASLYGIDAGEILLDSVKPYADIIGFKADGGGAPVVRTAQDKIDFIIKTVPDIVPKIDNLSEKVNLINNEIGKVDYKKYPEEIRGVKIRGNLQKVIEILGTTNQLIVQGKPLLENSDYFLGVKSPRTYMVIFQNDKELRPTGGFITAYTIARVDRGRFDPVLSDDIYKLDDGYTPSIKAPDQFPKYLQGIYIALNRFRLRDMNWSPDFETSMDMFTKEIKKVGISNIDGVIAVDTQMLVNLLDVLGKVTVPGYGDFSTKIVPECNCPQVIYELESFADTEGPIVWSENEPGKIVFAPKNYDNRKKIIGPLMNAILSVTLGQPDSKMPLLFEAAAKSLTEKHILFYFMDKDAEEAVKTLGVAGTISDYSSGDYLHINDANLGGRKSNLYVTQEVVQTVEKKEGYVENTLSITYKNPEKQDGWLNSVLPNWVRIYVPKGSELISNDGFDDFASPYEEFGKNVFAGFVKVRPLGVAKITLKYKVPMDFSKEYRLFIQKQPGKNAPLYTIKFGKKVQELSLITDKEIRL